MLYLAPEALLKNRMLELFSAVDVECLAIDEARQQLYVLDRFAYDGGAWLGVWQANWEWMRSDVDGEVLDFDAYHRQYQAKEDDIAQVEDYRGWLEDAGFETVCPYRCFNRALIVARVPG